MKKSIQMARAVGAALLVSGIAMSTAARADGYEEAALAPPPAEESRKFTYSFSLTGVSDYVFRGVSYTQNDPTVQGAVNVGYGIFYAGIWGSGLDIAPDGELEIDYYAGIAPSWGRLNFDFAVLYYTYPGYNDQGIPELDYLEWKAGVSTEVVSGLTATANFFYSDDVSDLREFVYEGILSYTMPKVWVFTPTVSGLIGYVDYDLNTIDYTYWNGGLALAVDNLTFDFRYWDTDLGGNCFAAPGPSACDERFVFSATVTVP